MRTDRTIPNNKPDIIIRDYEKGTCMFIDTASSGDTNVIKKEAEKILDITIEIQRMLHVKNHSDTNTNRGNWNHFKIIRTVPQQSTGKARN